MINKTQCPDCGIKLEFQEGCSHCPACGYSTCYIGSVNETTNILLTPEIIKHEKLIGRTLNYRLLNKEKDGIHCCYNCSRYGNNCLIPQHIKYWDETATTCEYHSLDKNRL